MNANLRQTLFKVMLVLGLGLSLAACTWSMAGGLLGAILTVLVSASLVIGAGTTAAGCEDPGANSAGDATQTGTDTNDADVYVGPCLGAPLPDVVEPDAENDVWVGPCLSPPAPDVIEPDIDEDIYVGPCLSPPAPDIQEFDVDDAQDVYVGPCLSQPPPDISEPDVDEKDVYVGPCLSQPLPDVLEPDTTEPDTTPPDTTEKDVWVGPCLSPPAPDIQEPSDTPDSTEKDIELQPCLSLPPPDNDEAYIELEPAQKVATRGDARKAIRDRLAARGVLPADVAERLRERKDG